MSVNQFKGVNGILLLLIVFIFTTCSEIVSENGFKSAWDKVPDRHWPGPEYWANTIQDWRIKNGRLECLEGSYSLRTLHLLPCIITERTTDFTTSVVTGRISEDAISEPGFAGFLIGAGNLDVDYRARAQIHNSSGRNGGLIAGLRTSGQLVFINNENSLKILAESKKSIQFGTNPVKLSVRLTYSNDGYTGKLTAHDKNGNILSKITLNDIPANRLTGNIALAAHKGGDHENLSYWFRDWEVSGSKVIFNEDQNYGPVLGTLFTQSRGILKLTAQFPVIGEEDIKRATLEVRKTSSQEEWQKVQEAELIIPGWTATFKIPEWDSKNTYDYRVKYDLNTSGGQTATTYYRGIIPKEPAGSDVTIAAFTGNYNGQGIRSWRPEPNYYDFSHNRMWFPHDDLDEKVKQHKPDLLVYTGDQLYEGSFVRPDKSGEFTSYIDYFNKWLLFYWAHNDLTRITPAVCITDDHDVFMINYWGEEGQLARDFPEADSREEMLEQLLPKYRDFTQHYRHDGGGYEMPPDWVNMVQRTQCSHLPEPYDPTPVKNGIEVYYTDMLYGGISFAILEDRKFKSAPEPLLPEANIRNGFPLNDDYDVRNADHPSAQLLGERQLEFLEQWSSDWEGAYIKVVLSATVLAGVNAEPTGTTGVKLSELGIPEKGEIPEGYAPSRDMDTNGWPQTGRNKALKAIRKGFGFMIAGDQHLATIVHHGTDKWEDAGFSFCVPSIANIAPRRWFTQSPGENRKEGMPPYTGRHYDAFGNKMYVWAAANPYQTGVEPAELYDKATGYGIVHLNKESGEITMECWPRWIDPEAEGASQFEGWPKTIDVYDNYSREAVSYLPTLIVNGLEQPPVVQVIDKDDQIIYTVRCHGMEFRPKVFEQGTYKIRIGEPGTGKMKTFTNLVSDRRSSRSLEVKF